MNQLHQQKDRLKGAQRKLMDVMNTLGLSNSLMGGTHAHLPCSVDTHVSVPLLSVVCRLPSSLVVVVRSLSLSRLHVSNDPMIESERRVCWAVIDRRQRMDRWIVYLGMAIMLAFLYLLYCA